MVTALLGSHRLLHPFLNEDRFFEHRESLDSSAQDARIRSLTKILRDGQLPPLDAEDTANLEIFLREQMETRNGNHDALDLYVAAKDRLTRQTGAVSWVQKATSYVFHADTVLEALPGARLVFMLRNPLDIAASLRIRTSCARWLRMCLGWRKGVARAEQLLERHSDRVILVRYEDLCFEPERECRRICDLCGLDYTSGLLSVDRVNPAEDPYATAAERSGITDEKVHYFRSHLTGAEQSIVLALAGRDLVSRHYPLLTDGAQVPGDPPLRVSLRTLVRGVAHIGGDVVGRFFREPAVTVQRFWRRLG